ncbi:MAG: hypothetical protein DMF60_03535 [Acidobacteria bacterium]|nr:MAG: hypothetical protein DMF60_03535 [Acidobacteriota bacterium]
MAKRSLSSEKTKRIFLVALGIVLAAVFLYQIFLSGPSSKPKRSPQAGANPLGVPPSATAPAPATPQIRQLGTAAQAEALRQQLLSDMTPLNLRMISSGGGGTDKPGERGNIFAYYVEPVAGVPRAFTLIVSGNKIPADAHILFDGAPRVTKRVSDTQLSTEMAPGDYVFPRNINVEIRSKSDPKENSNSIPFVVQAAPEPAFIYKGRLGALNQPQYNYGLFELTGTKEITRAKVGDTITGVWRIDAISADSVDLTHTQHEIKRRLPLQDKVR